MIIYDELSHEKQICSVALTVVKEHTNVQLNILIHLLSCSVSFQVICYEHSLYNL